MNHFNPAVFRQHYVDHIQRIYDNLNIKYHGYDDEDIDILFIKELDLMIRDIKDAIAKQKSWLKAMQHLYDYDDHLVELNNILQGKHAIMLDHLQFVRSHMLTQVRGV